MGASINPYRILRNISIDLPAGDQNRRRLFGLVIIAIADCIVWLEGNPFLLGEPAKAKRTMKSSKTNDPRNKFEHLNIKKLKINPMSVPHSTHKAQGGDLELEVMESGG